MKNTPSPISEYPSQPPNSQNPISLSKISNCEHSFRSLGVDYQVDFNVEYISGSRLVLFNQDLAKDLNLALPESEKEIEQLVLDNFSWFQYQDKDNNRPQKKTTTFFATRYQDSADKSVGSALGDGRAVWVGEIIKQLESGQLQYLDVVLKGTGTTPLAWFNHPRENHKDGQINLTEAVHEYIYSSAAKNCGFNAPQVLAVIELPFYRKINNENAAIVVRVGNHLRFAHYCYFADNPTQLKHIFKYGLKRDMGLRLTHLVTLNDVQSYLHFIVSNLASEAAIYFDVHAVHGSPTFGNITSDGGTIDFATFVFTDAHHSHYSYMAEGENRLGGEWGQTEQFFNLFNKLISTLKSSHFEYAQEINSVEYYLRQFSEKFEQILSFRWLTRIGLSENEINALSIETKEHFYENVKLIYELNGSKKIKFKQRKIFMAAFEPRNILSETANYIDKFDEINIIWEQLFKVNRSWGTYKLTDAKHYIKAYQKSVIQIMDELNTTEKDISIWQQRSKAIKLSERNEPGEDLFYDSERFFASEAIINQIKSGNVSWSKTSAEAKISAKNLVDHGLD